MATYDGSVPREWSPLLLRRPRALDIAALVVMAIGVVVDAVTIPAEPLPVVRYGALALLCAGAALVRWRPWPGLAVMATGPLVAALLGADPLPVWTFTIFGVFGAALRGVPALPAGLVVGAADYAALAIHDGQGWWDEMASVATALSLAAAAAGSAIRGHHRYRDEMRKRADEAMATREAEAERRVARERVRIARDLHDIVGHEVALISMHLGAAEVHLPPGADAAKADLEAARAGVQSVLRETQHVLGALRFGGDETTAPAADYARIIQLVEASQAAGLDVEATVDPAPAGLPLTVGVAAYRIVQELLTNAQRHGTGTVSLRVAADGRAVTIEAVNVRADGPRGGSGGGHGLVGMRERAASVGGTLEVREEGRLFWLRAVLGTDGEVNA